jgi:polyferredoxin
MSWPETSMNPVPSIEIVEFEAQNPPLAFLLVALALDILGFVCTVMLGGGGDVAGYVLALLAFVSLLGFRHFDGKARDTSYVKEITGLNFGVKCLIVLTIVLMTLSMWPIATEFSRNF